MIGKVSRLISRTTMDVDVIEMDNELWIYKKKGTDS